MTTNTFVDKPVWSWESRWFDGIDGTRDFATALTIVFPDGTQVRQSARTKDLPEHQEVNAIHNHRLVLAFWAERKHGIVKELVYPAWSEQEANK